MYSGYFLRYHIMLHMHSSLIWLNLLPHCLLWSQYKALLDIQVLCRLLSVLLKLWVSRY